MDLIIVKLILVLVVTGGFAFWQLHDVNRELRKHKNKEGQANSDRGAKANQDKP